MFSCLVYWVILGQTWCLLNLIGIYHMVYYTFVETRRLCVRSWTRSSRVVCVHILLSIWHFSCKISVYVRSGFFCPVFLYAPGTWILPDNDLWAPKHVAFTDEFNQSLWRLTAIHILICNNLSWKFGTGGRGEGGCCLGLQRWVFCLTF